VDHDFAGTFGTSRNQSQVPHHKMETDTSAWIIDTDGLSRTDVTAAIEFHCAVSPYFVCRTSYGGISDSVDRTKTLDEEASELKPQEKSGYKEGGEVLSIIQCSCILIVRDRNLV
jgi:hypothetical protein